MNEIIQQIMKNSLSGKIDKGVAADLIKRLMSNKESSNNSDIAIIGMALKMPLSQDVGEFWSNLEAGRDCTGDFPESRKADLEEILHLYLGLDKDNLKYVKGAYLPEIDKFDNKFFNISMMEAKLMDPNQKIFLETVCEAVEDAGYGGGKLAGTNTGVFVGYGNASIYESYIMKVDPSFTTVSITGNMPSVVAGRISYTLDLKGPSFLVDTACSSSLVAVYLACKSIREGDCDQAIAGGIKISFVPVEGVYELGIESKTDKTRSFDNNSDGPVWSEGSAAVLLKPLSKALEDRDNIYAVIKGAASNQDGTSLSIAAPNAIAQKDVIVKAWKDAKIDPETVSYIEAHGTGTKLGDPVELTGIQKAFMEYTDKKQFCGIGAVKSNIGHMDNVSGICGLIKAALSLKYKTIPPTLHFNVPNRSISFENSPVYVVDRKTAWETDGVPRRCGVNSFGYSGTNCHIVMEEIGDAFNEPNNINTGLNILPISAKSEKSLLELIKKYFEFIKSGAEKRLENICYTASTGRGHYEYRLALVFKDWDDLYSKFMYLSEIKNLKDIKADGIHFGVHRIMPNNKEADREGYISEKAAYEISGMADKKLEEFTEGRKYSSLAANEMCELYVKGANVIWEKLYSDKPQKVSLPVYAFDRYRCWLEAGKQNTGSVKAAVEPFYEMTWVQDDINQDDEAALNGTILVFRDEKGMADKLSEILMSKGYEVVEVEYGRSFIKHDPKHYSVGGKEEEYEKLLSDIGCKSIGHIFHFFSIKEHDENDSIQLFEESQERGVYSLFRLFRALCKFELTSRINISVISRYAFNISGNERLIIPENATLFGLGKVLKHESNKIGFKCFDIDDGFDANNIIKEISNDNNMVQVAFRNGKRYIEQFGRINLKTVKERNLNIRENGVYLITGGTGGIGLEIAKYLAGKKRMNIALVNRSKLPPENEWDYIIKNNKDSKLAGKIRGIREIENKGSEVVCFSADISNEDEVGKVLDELRKRYGRINGVIQGAGIAGDGFIINKDESVFSGVMNPKVRGTWLLDRLTQKDNPDFFILFSSINSLTGIPGQGDYTAANSYLDSYTAYRNRMQCGTTITINWSGWKEVGMAFDMGLTDDSGTIFRLMSINDAVKAFDKAIGFDVERVIIGEMNLDREIFNNAVKDFDVQISREICPNHEWYDEIDRILDGVEMPETLTKEIRDNLKKWKTQIGVSSKNNRENKQKNIVLKGRQEGELYSDIECKLAQIFCGVLDLEEISVDDDFFELGGNSILAIKVETEAEKRGFKIDTATIYDLKTIRNLASSVEKNEVKEISKNTGDVKKENTTPKTEGNSNIPGSKKIIDGIEPFNDIFYKSCFFNSFFPVLLLYNKDIEKILVNDTILYTSEIGYEDLGIDVEYIQHIPFEDIINDEGFELRTGKNSDDIIKDIIESITNDRPVIIWVDCYYESIRKDMYNKEHLAHTLLVYGYDKNEEVFHIIEHKHRDHNSYQKKVIGYDDIVNSHKGFMKMFNSELEKVTFYEFYHPQDSIKFKDEKKTQKSYIQSFMDNTINNRDLIMKGLESLKHFIDRFSHMTESEEISIRGAEKLLTDLNNVINAKKVEEYKVKRLFGIESEFAVLQGEIISNWNIIRNIVGKYVFSSLYLADDFKYCSEKLSEIYVLENNYYNKIFLNQ